MKIPTLALAAAAAILAGCGGNGENDPDATVSIGTDTMFVSDSIGVLMGDSCYMFGYIACAEALPGGGCIVLDQRTGLISLFDGEGGFIRSFGGFGEAPGKFGMPGQMTVLGDGRIAVIDWMDREACFFSLQGEYLGSRSGDHFDRPLEMDAAGDSSYITYSTPSRQIEGTFQMGFQVNVWEGSADEPRSTPFSHLFAFGQEEYDFRPGYVTVAGSPSGYVYLHRLDSDEYLIEVMDLDGDAVDSISSEPIIMSWDEAERYPYVPMVRFAVQNDGEIQQLTGEQTDHLPQVERLGVDSTGCIWAQRGTSRELMWDVFSPDGELERQIYLTQFPDSVYLRVDINEYGAVAWDLAPEDFPRIYLLSL